MRQDYILVAETGHEECESVSATAYGSDQISPLVSRVSAQSWLNYHKPENHERHQKLKKENGP